MEKIPLGHLNSSLQRIIKNYAKSSGKKFYVAWQYMNPKGEVILFARFGKQRDKDNMILALAARDERLYRGWHII